MPPLLALSIWFVLLVLLLRFDPAKDPEASWTLWIPVIWMSIGASRLPSQWFGVGAGTIASALEEGNPLDRAIYLMLLVISVAILLARPIDWGALITRNLAVTAYVSFAFLSILWSDFAYVSFKRWCRDLGSYLLILIVLSAPRPYEAVRTVLRHLCYLLIPLSIILIKYFDIGTVYDEWSGLASYVGVTTSKNMLGVLCLFGGIFVFWDIVRLWADRTSPRIKRIIFVDFGFILMTLYLLRLAHSATSAVCFAIGCMVIAVAHSKWGRVHPSFIKGVIPAAFFLYLILGFGLGLNAFFAEMLGRDPTLTDRTRIWSALLSMDTNPLVGTGYESFWLGSRLDAVFAKSGVHINEAHNGYLEMYLNMGLIGLVLLVCVLVTTYRNIIRQPLDSVGSFTSLTCSLWVTALFYNVTEASFKHGLMWLGLLLGAITIPTQHNDEATSFAMIDDNVSTGEVLAWESGPDRDS